MKNRVKTLLQSGEAAARAGNRAQARSHFRGVLAVAPDNVAALLWLAWLDDDSRASLAYVARAQELAPTNPRVQAALHWASQRRQDTTATRRDTTEQVTLRRPSLQQIGLFGLLGLLVILLALSLTVSWPTIPATSIAMAFTTTPTVTLTRRPVTPSFTATTRPAVTPTSMRTYTPSPFPTHTLSPSPTSSPLFSPSPPPATDLPTAPPLPPSLTPAPASVASSGVRWIDVDLTHQLLAAYEDQKLVRITAVSTGLPNTPTPIGQFHIWTKLRTDTMSGPGYYLTNVPYVMYFHGGYGLHGTYWHANFGQPMSHGCVNLPTGEAKWLFNWAEVGTLVNIHY